jgi:hypothetical protein
MAFYRSLPEAGADENRTKYGKNPELTTKSPELSPEPASSVRQPFCARAISSRSINHDCHAAATGAYACSHEPGIGLSSPNYAHVVPLRLRGSGSVLSQLDQTLGLKTEGDEAETRDVMRRPDRQNKAACRRRRVKLTTHSTPHDAG